MDKWEYLTQFIWADIENKGAREYIQKTWPNWQPQRFSPQTTIPELNKLGEEGWELIHMEPVPEVGDNHDVGFDHRNNFTTWSNVYFCVFKRCKSQPHSEGFLWHIIQVKSG